MEDAVVAITCVNLSQEQTSLLGKKRTEEKRRFAVLKVFMLVHVSRFLFTAAYCDVM